MSVAPHRAFFLASALLSTSLGCQEGPEPQQSAGRAPLTEREADFLATHWATIAPQGASPAQFSALESSLAPESCGACHPQQYQDWSTSLHAMAMGPGVWGQLVDMSSGEAAMCQRCHAPLAEQGASADRDHYDAALQQQGLVCAACHVRGHRRFGPPPSESSIAVSDPGAPLPHDGFTVETGFTKAAFCRGCHQFGPREFMLNGKLIENTYEEWMASPYPAQGIHCQDCHMPDRRHLWRGIHDPEMVASGVDVSVQVAAGPYRDGDLITATIRMANVAVGHYFPTYVTPKVFLRGELLDGEDRVLPATVQQATIGREVTLNLAREVFDTRIPPGEERSILYEQSVPAEAERLRITVEVHPDHFYRQFFEAVLAGGRVRSGRPQLRTALANAEASVFTLHEEVFELR